MSYSGSLSAFPRELRIIIWRFVLAELDVYMIYHYHKRPTRLASAASREASEIMTCLLLLNKEMKSEVIGLLERTACIVDIARDAIQPLNDSIPDSIISRTAQLINRGNGFFGNFDYFDQLQRFPNLRIFRLKPIWWEYHYIYDQADFAAVLSGNRNDDLVIEALQNMDPHLCRAEEIANESDLKITVLITVQVILRTDEEESMWQGALDVSVEIDLSTQKVTQLYVDMDDYSGFDYQSREHANVRLVPAEQVTLIDSLRFPALRHNRSGKVRALVVTPQYPLAYDVFFGSETYAQVKALNYRTYKETDYLQTTEQDNSL